MNVPNWALTRARFEDRIKVKKAFEKRNAHFVFKDRKKLKSWMKSKKWRTSWLFPEKSFYQALLANDENFQTALSENVVEILVPKSTYKVPEKEIEKIDQYYEQEEWDWAVECLREIRRAIDAGVVIKIGDQQFTTAGSFYTWAHKRYHILEEASDKWILDDR